MSKNLLLLSSLFLLAVSTFTSCGSSEMKQANLEISTSADGPFFEGPNSFYGDVIVDLASITGIADAKAENINSIKINSVTVNLQEGSDIDFSLFNSASLQLVSDDISMTTIAILNPIAVDGQSITLQASEEADLADYLKQDKFTAVLDLELKEYLELETISADLNIDINLEIKN